jgi:hypothetical protein
MVLAKVLAAIGVLAIGSRARGGEKLFGFSRLFISRCDVDICGENGSGRAGRLWYTRAPRNMRGRRWHATGRAVWRAMPCIVSEAAIRREVVEAWLRPTIVSALLGAAMPDLVGCQMSAARVRQAVACPGRGLRSAAALFGNQVTTSRSWRAARSNSQLRGAF